ncbi:MAG TPA: hypothetical protein VNU95_04740 [Candidatus Acidoferrales bacterium]|nr:hypothetical protein [Candidatus Acidoferrales bacterium]
MIAGLLAVSVTTATARLYDDFANGDNWILSNDSGTAVIETNVLLLTSPSGVLSTPTATCNSEQSLTDSRQSILVESHTGVTDSTVFFFWAIDSVTGNKLELKLDDVGPTTVVAGYYNDDGNDYNYVGSAAYNPGADGLYLAFLETNGMTHWQISTDASNWTDVASIDDPISTSSIVFEMQHKAYETTSTATHTTVGCFNYRLHGIGYYSIQTNTASGGDNWSLYTEGFNGGNLVCSSSDGDPCGMNVGGVTSQWHFTDTSIPAPYTNQDGFDFQIINTDEPTTHDYYNAYRYQYLPYVDADQWTYHIYFKYTYPQYITQGLEFPLNKYNGTNRFQGAFAWYPLRDGTTNGEWSVWTGSTWKPTGYDQGFKTSWWYELTFTVGLHDNQVFYNGFQAGTVGSLTSFNWTTNYSAPGSSSAAGIVPAMQIDDNIQDTTTTNTEKDCYIAEWHIESMYQRLP